VPEDTTATVAPAETVAPAAEHPAAEAAGDAHAAVEGVHGAAAAAPGEAVGHGEGDAHGGSEAHHDAFDIGTAILHHNMPYPAWEPVHGKPLITFDLGTYAAMNLGHLSEDPAFKDADGSRFSSWAGEVAAHRDFRYGENLQPEALAKAMALAEAKSVVAFPKALSWVNQQIFFGSLAMVLLFAVVAVFFHRKPEQVRPANRVQSALEAIVLYFRDTVVEPCFHGHGSAWTPFFVSIFLMILSVNLIGLIPGTGTLSGNIGVTGGFAAVVLLMMLGLGMKEQGPKFWVTLVPIHFTWALSPIWLLLLVIELLGLVIKPFALAVRLFANMFAGHTVLLVFLSLGYVIAAQSPQSTGLATGLGITGFVLGVGFHAMEILVAFIQAYVFTMLSAMFISASIHPEH
jgi:F-type H+-transporting ATPase subunit a